MSDAIAFGFLTGWLFALVFTAAHVMWMRRRCERLRHWDREEIAELLRQVEILERRLADAERDEP